MSIACRFSSASSERSGFIGAGDEDTDNAWHEGIELGVDWMEYVVWERNAPGQ